MLLKELSENVLLNEISPTGSWPDKVENLIKRGLLVELQVTDQFTYIDAKEVVLKLGGKIVDEDVYGGRSGAPARSDLSGHSVVYGILFPTEQDVVNAKKVLRRLQRGKPKFEIMAILPWSVTYMNALEREGKLDENINPGSGSPIRAGSMDLTPLSDKQKLQLVSRKGRYWRMSVRELKDALMRHKDDSRVVGRINQVLKAKREKREELSKITQPIDSWRGGGGY